MSKNGVITNAVFTDIIDSVCGYYSVTKAQILSDSRKAHIVEARYAVIKLCAEEGAGISEIGRRVNRHHATVWYALRKK